MALTSIIAHQGDQNEIAVQELEAQFHALRRLFATKAGFSTFIMLPEYVVNHLQIYLLLACNCVAYNIIILFNLNSVCYNYNFTCSYYISMTAIKIHNLFRN